MEVPLAFNFVDSLYNKILCGYENIMAIYTSIKIFTYQRRRQNSWRRAKIINH